MQDLFIQNLLSYETKTMFSVESFAESKFNMFLSYFLETDVDELMASRSWIWEVFEMFFISIPLLSRLVSNLLQKLHLRTNQQELW